MYVIRTQYRYIDDTKGLIDSDITAVESEQEMKELIADTTSEMKSGEQQVLTVTRVDGV